MAVLWLPGSLNAVTIEVAANGPAWPLETESDPFNCCWKRLALPKKMTVPRQMSVQISGNLSVDKLARHGTAKHGNFRI